MLRRLVRILSWVVATLLGALAVVLFFPFDQNLRVDGVVLERLSALRNEPKFADLPGAPALRERQKMEPIFNSLIDRLIVGVAENPRRSWVLLQMDPVVKSFSDQDTELREACTLYISRILSILGIERANGAFWKYLIFL